MKKLEERIEEQNAKAFRKDGFLNFLVNLTGMKRKVNLGNPRVDAFGCRGGRVTDENV